jgi:hypothetical protein
VAEKKMRERREFLERYSAFEDTAKFEANIDYGRKRGMVDEMYRVSREIDDEETQLRRIRERDQLDESVPVEPPTRRGSDKTDARRLPDGAPIQPPGADDEAPAGEAPAGTDRAVGGAGAALAPPRGAGGRSDPPVALRRRR